MYKYYVLSTLVIGLWRQNTKLPKVQKSKTFLYPDLCHDERNEPTAVAMNEKQLSKSMQIPNWHRMNSRNLGTQSLSPKHKRPKKARQKIPPRTFIPAMKAPFRNIENWWIIPWRTEVIHNHGDCCCPQDLGLWGHTSSKWPNSMAQTHGVIRSPRIQVLWWSSK